MCLVGDGRGAVSNRRRLLVVVAILAFAWFAVTPFLVPWLVARELPAAVAAQLPVKLTLGDVTFDPLRVDLALTDLRIEGDDGTQDALTVDRVLLDLRAGTLLRFAPVLAISLESPSVPVTRRTDGGIALAAWLPPTADVVQTRQAPPAQPLDLQLSLTVVDAAVLLTDRSLSAAPQRRTPRASSNRSRKTLR